MRLINVESLDIEEFFGDNVPKYAILSHTWTSEEVTLQEWSHREEPSISSKSGYQKILSACRLASEHRLKYAWVDTNCIDKSSSAELSEAINSMFNWYRNAQVCFAYLQDVKFKPATTDFTTSFQSSRWFTRGWTLQELLAPELIYFYDKDWTHMTNKKLCLDALSLITSIPKRVLECRDEIRAASIAQRMSWLSPRKTTRREDMAYCMFGIFDINLPLLYGEGDKAFSRLQEELIRSSHDHTIFCWTWPEDLAHPDWVPTLAPCAAAFTNSGKCIKRFSTHDMGDEHVENPVLLPLEYSVTNVGIHIRAPVLYSSETTCLLLLDAKMEGMDSNTCLAIPLQHPRRNRRSQTLFWRTMHLNGLIAVPHHWGEPRDDMRLAKSSERPTDYDQSNEYGSLSTKLALGSLPLAPLPRFAVMMLCRDQTSYDWGGIVFLEASCIPGMWCRRVRLFNTGRRGDYVTVTVRERQGVPTWGVTDASVAELEQGATHGEDTRSERSKRILGYGDQPAESPWDRLVLADELEVPTAGLGPLAGVAICPMFVRPVYYM
ncbi:hypothetical protein MY4824_003841 [Beauveria thailandica]